MNNYLHTGSWTPLYRPRPLLYIDRLEHGWLSNSTCNIGIGSCRCDADTHDITVTAAINLDITVSGIGGLDVGVEANSTWYYAWVIADSTSQNTVNGILSASPTNPTMPAGYDLKRRVGSIYNDSNGNFREFKQYWTGREKFYLYQYDNSDNEKVLNAGSAIVPTNVSCAAYVPPTSITAYIQYIHIISGSASTNAYLSVGSSVEPFPPHIWRNDDERRIDDFTFIITDANQNISYHIQAAVSTVSIIVDGYVDELT